jgi:hypothetical protein
MQELILILSRCQEKKISPAFNMVFFKFHFKGFYHGVKIKEILVHVSANEILSLGDDYLLWVRYESIKESTLKVKLLKLKKIE